MRLSPVLVAVFAASATFGLSNSANGQTAYPDVESSSNSPETFDQGDPSLHSSQTDEPSLTINPIPSSTPLHFFEEIVLNKTKSLTPELAFSLGHSIGKNISSPGVNSSFSEHSIAFNPSQPLSQTSLSDHPIGDDPENTIILNKGKATEDLERFTQASREVLPEVTSQETEILLNKSVTEKIGNFTFPTIDENAIALKTLPETNLVEPSLNKELGKIAQFPITIPEEMGSPEILLNKSVTEKIGNFTFPAIDENAIALKTLPETNLVEPSLNKELGKIAQFPIVITSNIAQITPETLPSNPEVPPPLPPQPELPPAIPIPTTPAQAEPEVLVAEIAVSGTENTTLIDKVYSVISTQPGRTTTRSQLQKDINAIFATGLFRNVKAVPEDTPLGVRVTFEVEENPPLKQVVIEGNTVLPEEIVNESFADQYNQTINLNQIEAGIKKINQWYQDNGYVLAQVVAAPEVTREGIVTLEVAEGIIENIQVRFLNSDGEATDEEGKPIEGTTRDFIITREIELKPGDVFNQQTAQRDLARVFGLGIFEDVRLQLEPGRDNPREATVIVNVIEKTTGSLAFGGGISSAAGLFGTLSYQELNLGGNNQRLGVELEAGNRIFQVDVSFTDPWIAGDPYRTSYTLNAFRRRTISVVFEDGEREVRLENGDRPRVIRTGGGISFTRPFAENVFADPNWIASLGFQYQRVQLTDADGDITPTDEFGNQLSYSGSGEDDLFTLQFGLVRDRRNNKQQPTSGYLLRFGTEQSIPIGSGSILMNRLRAGYTFYVPVNFFTRFIPKGPQSFAFNLQAGTVIGNLPPYEAFPLGGTASVRGWEEGAIASTRSFVQGSIEYRFPIFSNFIGGALFVDAATDLNSQGTVPGSPGGVRDKPGSGFGYGAGVRLQTPLGPVRVDYGINNNGDSRIHFGLGERF
ncbi:MAG: BamA/TamA family outer membrane protein [Planktothrix sp.]|uniref:BamA/TamA family outer membrane protein n=1 Tax=Planktothrix sp. TaxID=3088171 RepID=UPI0038D44A02